MNYYILCNQKIMFDYVDSFDKGADSIGISEKPLFTFVGDKQDFIEHISDIYVLSREHKDLFLIECSVPEDMMELTVNLLHKSWIIDYYSVVSVDDAGISFCPQWYTLSAKKLFTYKTEWTEENGIKYLTLNETEGISNSIIRFTKSSVRYACFSNFYRCDVMFDGILYLSSEAAWQAQKTLDIEKRKTFANMTPAVSKRAGRSVSLRPDWERAKNLLMLRVLLAKFSQNPELAEVLLSTGDAYIIEDTTAWHDNIWGHCTCSRCANKIHENRLGKILMLVRKALRGENIF